LVAVSSLKFIKFVAYEVAETLRPNKRQVQKHTVLVLKGR